jgi:hypothetical protein
MDLPLRFGLFPAARAAPPCWHTSPSSTHVSSRECRVGMLGGRGRSYGGCGRTLVPSRPWAKCGVGGREWWWDVLGTISQTVVRRQTLVVAASASPARRPCICLCRTAPRGRPLGARRRAGALAARAALTTPRGRAADPALSGLLVSLDAGEHVLQGRLGGDREVVCEDGEGRGGAGGVKTQGAVRGSSRPPARPPARPPRLAAPRLPSPRPAGPPPRAAGAPPRRRPGGVAHRRGSWRAARCAGSGRLGGGTQAGARGGPGARSCWAEPAGEGRRKRGSGERAGRAEHFAHGPQSAQRSGPSAPRRGPGRGPGGRLAPRGSATPRGLSRGP